MEPKAEDGRVKSDRLIRLSQPPFFLYPKRRQFGAENSVPVLLCKRLGAFHQTSWQGRVESMNRFEVLDRLPSAPRWIQVADTLRDGWASRMTKKGRAGLAWYGEDGKLQPPWLEIFRRQ